MIGTRHVLLLALALGSASATADIVRIHDLTPEQLGALRAQFDFWGLDRAAGAAVFQLDDEQRARLEAAGFRIETDHQREAEMAAWEAIDRSDFERGGGGTIPGFACYRTVTQTHNDLEALASQHPDRARWVEVGDSWQVGNGSSTGDTIQALVIENPESPHPRAPLVIMAAQHARELATAELATRFAELLVENPSADPDIDWLLAHRQVHIIAQQNPDGRREVEAGDLFWRKNFNESFCPGSNPGVDLNRNSSIFWGDFSSGNSCSDTFHGPSVASEPETQAVQNYLATVFESQRPGGLDSPAPDNAEGLFISIHSFGEIVLFPWEGLGGQNENNAPNHDALATLGRRFGFLTDYDVGRWQPLGPAGGTMVDYAYHDFGVAAYTFEVGTSFQQNCSSFEATIWPDNRQALLLAAKAARRPYLEPAGPAITALEVNTAGGVQVIGTADDGRFFRGKVTEPPVSDPVSDVVSIRVAAGAPAETGAPSWTFPVNSPAPAVDFDLVLPAGATLPANGRLFITAIDAEGQEGLPRVVTIDPVLFSDGFES
jgi:hypothetical protein